MSIAFFCITAKRTKYIHAQRSFHFLAERHKTLANGALAKRFVGETNVNRSKGDFTRVSSRDPLKLTRGRI